jgi:transcriptional regulator with XRE-family HTH domain
MGETLGQRLRRLREARGFSIPELASAVSASEGTIRQLETGQVKSPAFLLGLRIATALTVDPYYLALGSGFNMLERFDVMDRRITALESAAAHKSGPLPK